MANFYGVITAGKHGDRITRTSRTGDEYLRGEFSDAQWTYRLTLLDGIVRLERTRNRWPQAQAIPEELWDELWIAEGDADDDNTRSTTPQTHAQTGGDIYAEG